MEVKLRKLIGKDSRVLLKIFLKSGVKIEDMATNLTRVISPKEKDIEDYRNQLNEDDIKKFDSFENKIKIRIVSESLTNKQTSIFWARTVDKVLEKNEEILDDLHEFFSELSGLTIEQIENLELYEYLMLYTKIVKSVGIENFFPSSK